MNKKGYVVSKFIILTVLMGMLLFIFTISNINTSIDVFKTIDSHEYTWDLTKIYKTDKDWERDYKRLEQMIPEIEKYKGRLSNSSKDMKNALKHLEDMKRLNEKLYIYAHLKSDEDKSNDKYIALKEKAKNINIKLQLSTNFIEGEILSIPKEKINKFMKEDDFLRDYDFYFKELFRLKDRYLSVEEENIISLAGFMANTPSNIYDIFRNSERNFGKIKDRDGNEITLTPALYRSLMGSRDRTLRKEAFEKEFESFNQNINMLAANLAGEVGKNIFYSKARKYNSSLEASLDRDNVSVKLYENIINTTSKNLKPLHRYISLRKEALGIDDKVYLYDMYIPISNYPGRRIPFDEAKDILLDALKPLGQDYIKDLEVALNSRWIDVYERENKRTGAYSFGVYDTYPYVLLNYSDSFSDVSTLAHEMGHAMHSYYTNKHQPYIKSNYSIFTAEVASITNEALLFEYLIENASSKEEKIYLIENYIDLIQSAIYTQVMYAEFEKIIHEKVESGNTLNASILNEIWADLLRKYYGEDFGVHELSKIWWSRIPHFYRNFYVYKYVIGCSGAIALSEDILKSEEAREKYLEFLKSGASDYPINLLKKAGVDMTSSKPLEKAFKKFEQLIDEFEKLLKE
ncbi:oligoendopeptidase F [Alkalithermobacter thermoalcaliphilus JW-YL-7 = DSM 7308]|uniref:Oligopeptidase F n=1 Tax=Alkalithermobacter thermoalcaliphilus JW-YL-7 = DSM 7308 TaxID=1121328 RepID=A0A150FSF8_CLOPD|nr:oligoendopeptidase F [[Clostridium] paradoxum JW-YL-7 = DSM 7308]SHK70889.1 oligoendopeptidase F [[Clostridium] paradoxum JW-YL-7 = DSM 7308]